MPQEPSVDFSAGIDQPAPIQVGNAAMKLALGTLLAGIALLTALTSGRPAASQVLPEGGIKVEAPPLDPGLKWLNSEPLSMPKLKGKVVLLDFWEYTCVNCIRTLPYLKAWHDKYRDKGLVILGVHTPEFQFARTEANVAKAAKDFGLKYPIVVDSDYAVWRAYGNRYWPAKYLIDKDGFVRYLHFGEGGYENTESWVQKLLKELDPKLEMPPLNPLIRGADKPGAVCHPVTPELYIGYERGTHERSFGNPEGYHPGRKASFSDPGKWEDGKVYANGEWENTPEALISSKEEPWPKAYIGIKYHALEVNSVMRPEQGKPVKIWVYHDGKPVAEKDKGDDIRYDKQGRSFLILDQPRMYNIIKNASFAQRTLKLATAEPGMGIYSFTFVSCEKPKK
jgi:thiol-disulfide isomerase/thioredoxin